MKYQRGLPSLFFLVLLLAGPVYAETDDASDLPVQSPDTLNTLISIADTRLILADDGIRGIQSLPMKGRFTIAQVLDKDRLNHELLDNPLISIKEKIPDSIQLPKITVTDTVDQEAPDNRNYNRTSIFSATKTNASIMETPVSVQVVPRAILDDQKAVTLADALQNVSGVQPQSSVGVFNSFITRGFQDFRQYRNGLRVTFTDFDTANLERLEVLKGPASVLFGRVEPGGLINMITKQPRSERYLSLEQQFGSYDFYRTLWDGTGAITDNGNAQYRLSGSYQNSGSFRDFHKSEQYQIYTALAWDITNATRITVAVEGFNKNFQSDQGLPAINNRPASIPVSRSFQDSNDPLDNVSNIYVDYNLSHRFNKNWTLHNRFMAQFGHFDLFDVVPAFFNDAALRSDNRTLDRTLFFQRNEQSTYTTNLDLTGNFEFWNIQHEVLLGLDYYLFTTELRSRGDAQNADPSLAIDIFNPTTRIDPIRFRQDLLPRGSFQRGQGDWFGVYFQDQIKLWDKWYILGGGRYDWASAGLGLSRVSFSDAEDKRLEQRDQAFSPRVGVLYRPWQWLSLYGNWTQSFGVNNAISATGRRFDPQIGEQLEAGVKTAFFNEQLIATVAFYNIDKSNILTPDLSTSDPLDRIAIGKARSKGIEFDLSGRLTNSLSLIGNYAYTDAKITKDNSGLAGNKVANVPKHAGSIWLKYDHSGIRARDGLSLGFGVFAVGARQGDNQNTFILPGYTRLDMSVAYRLKIKHSMLTAQVNVRNLLDKDYYRSTSPLLNGSPRLAILPGEPRVVLGSLRLEY